MSRRAPTPLRSRAFRRDRIAWAIFAIAAVALGVATKAWLHRRVFTEADAAASAPTLDYRLTVLAYDRIGAGESERHVAADRLEEHFEALREAGFQPVSLRQVRDAFRGGAPLPERPVLLTFDGGHLSTYQAVDPLLRSRRWPAAMFLDPNLQEARHATYVYWDRLRRMVASGLWDIGTLGHSGEDAALLERRLRGYEVLGSVSPRPAEGGRGDGAEPPRALAFENSIFGMNDRSADPRRLFRLRVPRAWSGRELTERLEYSLSAPQATACSEATPIPAARWVAATGRLEAGGETMTLTGAPRGEAWLAGGEWADHFVFEVEVRPRGVFWVVQQAVGSREQWRWGGTGRTLYLQRLRPGEPAEVVSRVVVESRSGPWHSVRLVKRGEGVWVEWDGERIADMPRAVAARWRRGHVGLATGTPSDAGQVEFRNARFAAIPYRVRSVSASPPQHEVQALLEDAPCLAAISPPGLAERGSKLRPLAADRQLLEMVAAFGAWELLPEVEISDVLAGDMARAEEVADHARREGWAGIRLVPRERDRADADRWRAAAAAWEQAFAGRGLRFVLDAAPGEGRTR